MDAMSKSSDPASSVIKGPITVVAAVIRNAHGHILIARRPDSHAVAGGLWEFPGGKVEAGESPEEALRREIKEEIGIEIEVKNLINVVSHVYALPSAQLHILLIGYFADFVGGNLQLNDVAEVEWVSQNQRPMHQFAPADVPFLEKVWPNKR
jgi:8-oxo-dGTP diphosphatase